MFPMVPYMTGSDIKAEFEGEVDLRYPGGDLVPDDVEINELENVNIMVYMIGETDSGMVYKIGETDSRLYRCRR